MAENDVFLLAKDKKVLFITTKNIDYIRNTQEIGRLEEIAASVKVLGYLGKYTPGRLLKLYFSLFAMPFDRYDIIFVGFSPQLVIPLFGWRLKNKIVVEDFFISLYDTFVHDRKRVKDGGMASRFLCFIDKITLSRADAIVADTWADARYFETRLGAKPEKLNVVYLKADTKIYFPQNIPKPRELQDKFVVLYFGSILPLQGVEIILGTAEKLRDSSDVVFEMIGPLPKKTAELYGRLENVVFTRWLSQEKLAERIAYADLCLAGHFNAQVEKASRTIPGKAYIYSAMQKPMILGDNPANRERFGENDSACFYVEMGDAQKLKEKILAAKDHIRQ